MEDEEREMMAELIVRRIEEIQTLDIKPIIRRLESLNFEKGRGPRIIGLMSKANSLLDDVLHSDNVVDGMAVLTQSLVTLTFSQKLIKTGTPKGLECPEFKRIEQLKDDIRLVGETMLRAV